MESDNTLLTKNINNNDFESISLFQLHYEFDIGRIFYNFRRNINSDANIKLLPEGSLFWPQSMAPWTTGRLGTYLKKSLMSEI